MKKIKYFVIALCLCASLTACSQSDEASSIAVENITVAQTATAESSSAADDTSLAPQDAIAADEQQQADKDALFDKATVKNGKVYRITRWYNFNALGETEHGSTDIFIGDKDSADDVDEFIKTVFDNYTADTSIKSSMVCKGANYPQITIKDTDGNDVYSVDVEKIYNDEKYGTENIFAENLESVVQINGDYYVVPTDIFDEYINLISSICMNAQ